MNGLLRRAASPEIRAYRLLLLAPLSIALLASHTVAGQFETVALSGQPSPDSNGNLVIFTMPALNDTGQVAFLSQLSGTINDPDDNIALYRGTAAGLAVVARKGVTGIGTNLVATASSTTTPPSMPVERHLIRQS